MNLIEMARKAGMQVLLDAQIGRETYHSVCGPISSLQRFAEEVVKSMNPGQTAPAFQEGEQEP
ncbi:hypothetical protein GNZ13_24435 [Paraburkholderia sp. 5N]|uniref:Uncharacterized protein n=1 Tax=Paraburkholderia elongata TaxID=2675747 RepID=A0A972NTK9_9BURK|nr:hypothetical protein [Paraburkholderia elongata]